MISLNFYNAIYQTIAIFLCFPGMGADFIKKKTIKRIISIPFSIQLLIKQKNIKRDFIKTRNPFLKSAKNAITEKKN